MTYGHALAKEPCTLGHEIYNFGTTFIGHHYCILDLCHLRLGEEKIFKEKMHFHQMTCMATP